MTRDAVPHPLAVEAIAQPALDGDEDLPTRQCGRCRLMFAGDPTLDIRARQEWWLCPDCEALLLPLRAKKSNVIPFPRPLRAPR